MYMRVFVDGYMCVRIVMRAEPQPKQGNTLVPRV